MYLILEEVVTGSNYTRAACDQQIDARDILLALQKMFPNRKFRVEFEPNWYITVGRK